MGSKAKHANQIIEVISCDYPVSLSMDKAWVEPFVGGCNMIDKINKNAIRIGNDINPYLISMFQALQKGWIPPDYVTQELYKEMHELSKTTQESETVKATIGFIGIGCSYSGKWFGGYARGNDSKGNPRNYCLESKKNVMNQMYRLNDVIFTTGNYLEMEIPSKSIIYCDPPYENTTKYKDSFDHKRFWLWCDEQIDKGHKVYVSEYNAPQGWRCIWEKQVNNSLTKETGSKQGIEKLFTK